MTQTIDFPTLTDQMRTLPMQGAGRDRQLHRLIDLQASAAAAAALHAAAVRTQDDTGILAAVLAAADAVTLHAGSPVPHDAAIDRLRGLVMAPEFLALVRDWVRELREAASVSPGAGTCTLATALELWSWTVVHFRGSDVAFSALDELAVALAPLLAARCLALDLLASPAGPAETELRSDLCHVHVAHASALAASACAELVFGYRRHLVWDAEGCASCYESDALDELEATMPGMASGARISADVVEADGSHPLKAGPCARFDGVDAFMRLRHRLDGCLTGARLAKERAVVAIGRSTGSTAGEGKA